MKPSKTLATAVIAVLAAAIYFFFPSVSEQAIGEAVTGGQGEQASQQQRPGASPGAAGHNAKEALAALESLTVSAPIDSSGYDRDEFGSAWTDVDGNSCDTRNDVLARDLVKLTYTDPSDKCEIASGVLKVDPFTGERIEFERGVGTSNDIQIDHIFALSLSWQHGARNWDEEKREQFANDPLNLVAADGSANASKGDSGPAEWLPSNGSYTCTYVAQFVTVAAKYDLTLSQPDYDASESVLTSCV